jgi:hypothetical protein
MTVQLSVPEKVLFPLIQTKSPVRASIQTAVPNAPKKAVVPSNGKPSIKKRLFEPINTFPKADILPKKENFYIQYIDLPTIPEEENVTPVPVKPTQDIIVINTTIIMSYEKNKLFIHPYMLIRIQQITRDLIEMKSKIVDDYVHNKQI